MLEENDGIGTAALPAIGKAFSGVQGANWNLWPSSGSKSLGISHSAMATGSVRAIQNFSGGQVENSLTPIFPGVLPSQVPAASEEAIFPE